MAALHPIQAQRFELKFIIPESLSQPIRDFISPNLVLDAHAQEDRSYPIHSIYLDSPSLKTYQATLNGDRNRYKLRVRYYDDKADSPVFLELKRKFNDVVRKQRCMLTRDSLPLAIAGDSTCIRPKDQADYAVILPLIQNNAATPRAHVAYRREAWVSRLDNSVRVTMDRQVRVEPCFGLSLHTKMQKPVVVFNDNVVLELKFTSRYPQWFRDMIHVFNIMQCGAAKYTGGVELYGEQHFRQPKAELRYG